MSEHFLRLMRIGPGSPRPRFIGGPSRQDRLAAMNRERGQPRPYHIPGLR